MKVISFFIGLALLLFTAGCATTPNNTAKGAGAGALVGAGLGAIVGNQTGDAGPGIAIGAAAGALTGGAIGHAMDADDEDKQGLREEQLRQQEEIERQRREIEDLRRQQRYDDRYRQY